MAVTFYSYMLITFSTSYSTKLNLESNMFKSLLSARSKNAWILSWQQHANLEDFSLLSWRMLSLFEVRMWEVSMLARPTGSPWSHASTARKCIVLALSCESRCAHSEETACWEVFRANTQGSCSSVMRPVIWHQVPFPAVCLELPLPLQFRMFWDKL